MARLKLADVLDNVRDTLRGIAKGHDVWARFRAGVGKVDYWETILWITKETVGDEPLWHETRDAVHKARREALRRAT